MRTAFSGFHCPRESEAPLTASVCAGFIIGADIASIIFPEAGARTWSVSLRRQIQSVNADA